MKRTSIRVAYLTAALITSTLNLLASNPTCASTEPRWVSLDADFHRQGDKASIQRQGPWVEFAQIWGDPTGRTVGKPRAKAIVERMAVNCLTGAYGQTEYPSTDARTGKRVVKQQTFDEIEHAEDFDSRLVLTGNSTALGRSLIDFACTCKADAAEAKEWASPEPSQSEMQTTYDRYIAEPLSKVEYHLRFLRVKSKQTAEQAIAELTAGKSFETVFDEYASPADAHTFPQGDMGPHLETEFPIDDVRRFRALQVGIFSRVPHEGVYGWEIEELQAKRTLPAPSFASMQPRLRAYFNRARACGWPP